MDNNKKMLILGGGAAVFAALGYLGLQLADDEEESNENNPELVFTKMNKTVVNGEETQSENVEESGENKKLKEEVSVEINTQKLYNSLEKEDDSGWGKWWRNEYSTAKEEVKNEVEVSDNN